MMGTRTRETLDGNYVVSSLLRIPVHASASQERTTVTLFMNSSSRKVDHGWRFLTNHALVLTAVAVDPNLRLRDIAAAVGITERAAAQLINDLEQAGYLTRTRIGRRNTYEVHDELPLRHARHRHQTVGELIRFLRDPAEVEADTSSQPEAANP
jgi:Winged helix-turn-helix DNA-binding